MTMRKPASLARLALVVGVLGCATLSGCAALFLTLEPGVSRKEQVLAKYGAPDEIRQRADGSIVYEYPREPEGRENYRVTLSPDGTLRSVSVGYRVHRYTPIQDPNVGTVHRAVDWEPYEISVVPIPVDPAAEIGRAHV